MSVIFFKKLFLSMGILLFIGCSQAPVTHRNQIITSDNSKELALAKKMSDKILKRSKISKNQKAIKMVNEVGMKLVEVVNQEYNTNSYDWKFTVIEDQWKASAICLPNGSVFIYSGLFPYINNDDELAVVLGHEIAHALARHKVERKTSSAISSFTADVMKLLILIDTSTIEIQKEREREKADELMNEWIMLPHSRTHEYEADHIGLVLSAKAGYNPKASLSFWKKFPQKSAIKPEYASTHPTPLNRMKKIETLIPSLLLFYHNAL